MDDSNSDKAFLCSPDYVGQCALAMNCDLQLKNTKPIVKEKIGPIARGLWGADAAQCIDRISSRASNGQQQEASHNAEIFVKVVHTVNVIRTCCCPIAMTNK